MGYAHSIPLAEGTHVWEDKPQNRTRNDGWGLCNTGSGKRVICCFGGIGCDVDHVTIRRQRDQPPDRDVLQPDRYFTDAEIDEISRELAKRTSQLRAAA